MQIRLNQHGDKRVRTIFLLLPRWTSQELRWLETATIEEKFVDSFGPAGRYRGWIFERFINKPD